MTLSPTSLSVIFGVNFHLYHTSLTWSSIIDIDVAHSIWFLNEENLEEIMRMDLLIYKSSLITSNEAKYLIWIIKTEYTKKSLFS